MCHAEFRVVPSSGTYAVELLRDGEPYVVFLHGLKRQAAEEAVRDLTRLWRRISPDRTTNERTTPGSAAVMRAHGVARDTAANFVREGAILHELPVSGNSEAINTENCPRDERAIPHPLSPQEIRP